VFRNDQAWRPNPPIDDGHYTTLTGTVTFDTRNDRLDPTAGWFLRARFENSRSKDVTPRPEYRRPCARRSRPTAPTHSAACSSTCAATRE